MKPRTILNAHIRGRTLAEAKTEIARLREETKAALDSLSQALVEKGLAVWAGTESDLPARLIVRGRANLLENVTAQADIELLKHLFDDLETKDGLMQLLDLAEEGSGVRIFIGSENRLFSLSGSSLVVAPYRDKDFARDRRAGRHRPDKAELCPHRPDGRLHRAIDQPHVALVSRF